jgi:ankyrin repeat protein
MIADDAGEAKMPEILASGRPRNAIERTEVHQRQGATQLANALITYNTEAAAQIMATYTDGNLDVDYTDVKHGYPLCSLALITGQADIALKLLEMGADPLKPNTSGRTVMYVAAEAGLENVIRCIVQLHPELDLNAPITSELQRYSPIHVAARLVTPSLVLILVPV